MNSLSMTSIVARILFVVFFGSVGCSTHRSSRLGGEIRVAEEVLFGDMDCYRIETPTATYFYGKRGAGFAKILDRDGHDWIGYHHGGKARGEYRGLPKSGQPIKYFHCGYGFGQYTNENWFESCLTLSKPDHVRIRSITRRQDASCTWDFYRTHATMTLERCGTNTFWFLYEGTPGGELNVADDFVVLPSGKKSTLDVAWEAPVPWVVFGAKESPWGFWLFNHQPAVMGPGSYVSWPYKPEPDGGMNQMTIFGWGRLGWQSSQQHTPQLRELPSQFSLGFVQGTELRAVEAAIANVQTGKQIPK